MYRFGLTVVLLSVFILSFTTHLQPGPARLFVLRGVVTDEAKKPLQKVHVFTVSGEEEAITDQEGKFSFKTAQAPPIRLTAQLQDYKDKATELTAAPGLLTIEIILQPAN